LQEGEGAVSQFHGYAGESLLCLGDVNEVEDDGLVVAQHISVCDSEEEGVADLSGGSGDGYSDGFLGVVALSGVGVTKVAKVDLANNFISTLIIYI
jgi:hypothetical protein